MVINLIMYIFFSLGSCMICEEENAKYKCPCCEALTCSLSCSTEHKAAVNCDGVRSRTKFQRTSDMNEFTVLNGMFSVVASS